MRTCNCPSCGAEITFQSSFSVYAVCRYCSAMIVRNDMDVKSIGTMASLPPDISPFQIGTYCEYQNVSFQLIGRMKIGWTDGAWNEWFFVASDGRKGWLAEAQGTYAISFEISDNDPLNVFTEANPPQIAKQPDPEPLSELNAKYKLDVDDTVPQPALGKAYEWNDKTLHVVDVKDAICIGSEGELPFAAPQGRRTLSVDLLGTMGEFACIEIDKGKERIFVGQYVEWDELNCSNIRVPEDQSEHITSTSSDMSLKRSMASPKSFTCPACGGVITLKMIGDSITCTCQHCSSVIDVQDDRYKILETAKTKTLNTVIPLGATASLFDQTWEVTGYVMRQDSASGYAWDEYLLHNPYYGYRFLQQADGHWTFIKLLKRDITSAGMTQEIWVDDEHYKIFFKGTAIVRYVKGEFYWRIRKTDKVQVTDYISPLHIVSVERDASEKTLSYGVYIPAEDIKNAFKITTDMPRQKGVAPNQPNPYQSNFKSIWAVALISLVAITCLHLSYLATAAKQNVTHLTGELSAVDGNKTYTAPVFVQPTQSNILIRSHAGVTNDWAEISYSLVNDETNISYNLTVPVEYYYGYASDGYWSEGQQSEENYIASVPPGHYRLLIDTDSGVYSKRQNLPLTVDVIRDVPSTSNYLITLIMLLIYPCWVSYRRSVFETERWAEADYTQSGERNED